MISTSVCKSIPRSRLRLRLQNADQCQNIRRRGIAVVHQEIAVFQRNLAPPTRVPLSQARQSICLPDGRRFLNRQPALGAAGWNSSVSG